MLFCCLRLTTTSVIEGCDVDEIEVYCTTPDKDFDENIQRKFSWLSEQSSCVSIGYEYTIDLLSIFFGQELELACFGFHFFAFFLLIPVTNIINYIHSSETIHSSDIIVYTFTSSCYLA